MHDVIVAGGGVIGLAVARELAGRGRSVLVIDSGASGAAASASSAAAGMLSPLSEAGESNPFFQLCMASLRIYRTWTDHLREESGIDPEYACPGLLYLASSAAAAAALQRRRDWQRDAGFAVEWAPPAEVRRIEPLLTLPAAGALLMRDEHHVTPRRLLSALRTSCIARNVEIQTGFRVHEILVSGNRVEGVRAGSERILGGAVVVSSGAWSSEIAGLQPRIPVYPRKGQILSLAAPGRSFRRMIRWEHAYFVPRKDGVLIVGATDEDAGFDASLTPAGVGGLLAAAQQISSHTAAFPILEMWTGFRPATPDGLPLIGRAELEQLFYATGHYRNGILLAPITASIVADLMEGREPEVPLGPYSPFRFQ